MIFPETARVGCVDSDLLERVERRNRDRSHDLHLPWQYWNSARARVDFHGRSVRFSAAMWGSELVGDLDSGGWCRIRQTQNLHSPPGSISRSPHGRFASDSNLRSLDTSTKPQKPTVAFCCGIFEIRWYILTVPILSPNNRATIESRPKILGFHHFSTQGEVPML